MANIEKLSELALKATQGPWAVDSRHGNGDIVWIEGEEPTDPDSMGDYDHWIDCNTCENAQFIAAANPAVVLELVAEIKRLQTELRRLGPSSMYVAKLESDAQQLRNLCGEVYQVCGVHDASENVLDNLLAAASGFPIPHETLLPYQVDAVPAAAVNQRLLDALEFYATSDPVELYTNQEVEAYQRVAKEAIAAAMDLSKTQPKIDTSPERVDDCAGSHHAVDWPDDDSRIDVIGANGGDGLHYVERGQ